MRDAREVASGADVSSPSKSHTCYENVDNSKSAAVFGYASKSSHSNSSGSSRHEKGDSEDF